jgi:hypothetical protein
MRCAARDTVIRHYDAGAVCLPAYLDLLQSLLRTGRGV